MARMARAVVAGVPYHVTHRGNRRTDIFYSTEDRDSYRRELQAAALRYGLEIWAYCLMSNHVHLIVVPRATDSLARAVGLAHRRHSVRINHRKGWTGHLWSNRFFSCALDRPHLWRAVRYVELNPVRARLAKRPEDYAWSSARAHALGAEDELLAEGRPFPGRKRGEWSDWLAQGLTEKELDALRMHTRTGRPLGSPSFLDELESTLGRVLRPQRPGRKPKSDRDRKTK